MLVCLCLRGHVSAGVSAVGCVVQRSNECDEFFDPSPDQTEKAVFTASLLIILLLFPQCTGRLCAGTLGQRGETSLRLDSLLQVVSNFKSTKYSIFLAPLVFNPADRNII